MTFLLTDIEGSTARWEQEPEAMRAALGRHDALFEAAVREHRGSHIRPRGEGDSRFAVFSVALDAASCALAIQRAFLAETWPTSRPLRVRIGIHTGEAVLRDGDYYGSAVNRCARIRSIGHGGQILLSEAVGRLLRDGLPDGSQVRELGLHRLRDLTHPERIVQLSAPDLPSEFPPLASLDLRSHNLPIHRSALIGRDRELADVRALLLRTDVGLVTLIGPGGTGKTRLAAQVAADSLDQFADGAYFVALGPIRDPDLVAATIGQVLSVPMDGGRLPLETLKDYVRDRELLLVLDNLEQVLDAAPQFVELLAAAERLKLLVTSRVALRVSEEREYEVPPLGLPERAEARAGPDLAATLEQYDAIRLFVERAQAVRADFSLTGANAVDVAELCRRLDGLPLAIELAAARARLLPPSAMLARLAGPMGAPALRLLTGGPRDQPARLQTLRNTIAWSYDLLEPEEQIVFRRLAIFVGGSTLDAIERVASFEGPGPNGEAQVSLSTHIAPLDTLDVVDSLLAKSLLRRVDGLDGEPRYVMLETIREFGVECLALTGELAAVQRSHAECFLELAETAEPLMRGPEQALWLDRLEADYDNLRAALAWGRSPDGDPQLGLRLGGALAWFWHCRTHIGEARQWLAGALDRAPEPSLARVSALAGAGWLAHIQKDAVTARALLGEGLMLARQFDSPWWASWILHLLGRVAYFDGDAEAARLLGEESLAVARGIEDEWLVAWALHLLGLAAHVGEDFATARQRYEESLAIRRRLDFREGSSTVLTLSGILDYREGQYASARERYLEALGLLWGIDWGWLLGNQVAELAALAVALEQPERAARLSGALSALSEAVSARPIPLVEAILMPALEQARRTMGEAAFLAEQQVGRRMSRDDVLAEAFAIEVPDATAASPSTAQPDGLTTREVEVLGLIAAGCSSREIAERLVISIHTVERHITHVYQKIGARGRAEATAYAMRHGLS